MHNTTRWGVPRGLVALVVATALVVTGLVVLGPRLPSAGAAGASASAVKSDGLTGMRLASDYVTPPACQTVEVPRNYNPGWIVWQGSYHRMGTFRIADNCGRFNYRGGGLRFSMSSCVFVRLRMLGDDWTFDFNTTPIQVCGSASAIIAGFPAIRPNDRFYLECWASSSGSRNSNDWCVGRWSF